MPRRCESHAREYAHCQRLRGEVWARLLADMVARGELGSDRDLETESLHVMAFELSMNVYGLLNPAQVSAELLERHVDEFVGSPSSRGS